MLTPPLAALYPKAGTKLYGQTKKLVILLGSNELLWIVIGYLMLVDDALSESVLNVPRCFVMCIAIKRCQIINGFLLTLLVSCVLICTHLPC